MRLLHALGTAVAAVSVWASHASAVAAWRRRRARQWIRDRKVELDARWYG